MPRWCWHPTEELNIRSVSLPEKTLFQLECTYCGQYWELEVTPHYMISKEVKDDSDAAN